MEGMKSFRLLSIALALIAPSLCAADPVRIDLAIKSPITTDIRAIETGVIPGNLGVPALRTDGLTLPAGEIPVLPPTVVVDGPSVLPQVPHGTVGVDGIQIQQPQIPLENPEAAITARGEEPTVLASLQGLALPQNDLAPRYFDKSRPAVTTSFAGDGTAPAQQGPRRPRGVTAIDVAEVHGPADIIRLIPNGVNSDGLKAKLIEHVDTMAPYRIYTYRDSRGGSFTGIDLSLNPALINVLPEQQSHEVRLIKKIQVLNKDLQVLVRETGKTPDLVVGGVVTELKSLIGDKVDLTYLVNKANNQVHEHAQRHALGNGAVVIDLTAEKNFTPELTRKISGELDLWSRLPAGYELPGFYTGPRVKKQQIALDKVYFFAGADLRMFVRHNDGAYRLSEPAEIPFHLTGAVAGLKKHQLFLRQPGLARPPPPDTMLGAAFDQHFLIKELRTMVAKGRVKRAYEIWSDFNLNNKPETVRRVRNEIDDIYSQIMRGRKQSKKGSSRRS